MLRKVLRKVTKNRFAQDEKKEMFSSAISVPIAITRR